tara:strand:- start:3052 stop:5430 length:2379 start_codon:yes stop_codon:yes gene_type:complete
MSFTLVIVESPAKCKKIENYLGNNYRCIASYGHFCQLDGLKSIDIENNFKPTFTLMQSKEQQVEKMRKMIDRADDVMLASDDDREGEAIAWHICNHFNLPVNTTKRIIFHEITKPALLKAVKEPITINMEVVNAQQARQILDMLVGYYISPILWKKISQNTKTGLSAGRCQTPALRLVYDNKKEIDESPGRKVYNITGYFTNNNIPFVLNYNYDNENNVSTFLEETVNYDHIYECSKEKNVTKNPPKPFTTSGLQQMASNELRISPKNTMAACQKLYEGGYITYMRTDSIAYSKEFLNNAEKFIKKTYGDDYVNINLYDLCNEKQKEEHQQDNKKGKEKKGNEKKGKEKKGKEKKGKDNNAQEAHESIRPTNINVENIEDNETMDKYERRVYKLIRRNTLESCMAAATFKSITAKINSPEDHQYRYTSEQIVFAGWKKVSGYEEISPYFAYLQNMKNGIIVNYKKIICKVTMKDLKTHYTEAKLVQLLEKKGIGRPSTFSSLIDKIQDRNYVKKMNVKGKKIKCIDFELEDCEITEDVTEREFGNEKDKLVIQPLGIMVIEFLITQFDQLFQYDYTKSMEDTLDIIAKGDKIWYELCNECLEQIKHLSGDMLTNRNTITIDDNHTYMIAKYGPVIKCEINNEITFKKVREDIDLEKLRNGKYQLNDLLYKDKEIGVFKDKKAILKKGQYGYYIDWNSNKYSIKIEDYENINNIDDITLDIIIPILEKDKSKTIIRTINETTSIRKGKYGDYIFYKTTRMKKPKFLKLDKFDNDYKLCELNIIKDWLKNTYDI